MQDLTLIDFGLITDLIRDHATSAPTRIALVEGAQRISYAQLDAMVDRVACALQRDGLTVGDAIAVCAGSSIPYAAVYLGALRAGVVVAPLAPSSTPEGLRRMVADARAKLLFTDDYAADVVGAPQPGDCPRVALDGGTTGTAFLNWLVPGITADAKSTLSDAKSTLSDAPPGNAPRPQPVALRPDSPFNIIYSSGTTGEPKGIVQSHGMRWAHVRRGATYDYNADTVTVLSTPLYSNTTLVVFFPTLSCGGCVVLMPKFEARAYLELAQAHRATHTMLVPVQYQRLMSHRDFDSFDLSSFKVKFSTSAPFNASVKADVLKRWPGGLVEFYGMTEGGGTCILEAHNFPDKLHTVGQPALGHDIRLIDDEGREVAPGESGEVVGHSGGMMTGYFGQADKTRAAEWFDASGKRFIRTGDVGRFDAEGFLTLFDRKKDMIISGGFNIYPSDLEAVLREHPAVLEASVIGVPSELWGETPVAYVVCHSGQTVNASVLQEWFAQRVGKTQRLSAIRFTPELPRSAIGKVLKRELRDAYVATTHENTI